MLKTGTTDAIVLCNHGDDLSEQAFSGCDRVTRVVVRDSEKTQRLYASTIGRGMLTMRTSLPFEYTSVPESECAHVLKREFDLSDYDLVWISGAGVANWFGSEAGTTTVLDGDDFSYIRNWHLLRSSEWYGAKIWNYIDVAKLWWRERRLDRQFDFVVRCSEEDRLRHPGENIVVIPNGTEIPDSITRAPEKRLLFIGDVGYEPNTQGLNWFIEKIWPLVLQQVPDACVDIVGRNEHHLALRADGINTHGYVEDLEPFFHSAACSIVPLRAGGGTRLKVLESLAYEVPVVSTEIGAFGVDLGTEHGLDLSNSDSGFADCCATLLTNPELGQTRAENGRAFVRDHYDWASIENAVSSLIERAIREKKNIM